MGKHFLVIAVLVWSTLSQSYVTPEVLEQQGQDMYGALWPILRPVFTGAGAVIANIPSAPTNLSIQ